MEFAADLSRMGTTKWRPDLDEVARAYGRGDVVLQGNELFRSGVLRGAGGGASETLLKILANPLKFPSEMVLYAERALSRSLNRKGRPVAKIARTQRWFTDEVG
jgi:hypothetical protein